MNKIILYIILTVIAIFIIYKFYRMFIKKDISKKGQDFIRGLETSGTYYPRMILDSVGLPTIGVGHLIRKDEKFEGVDLMTGTLTDAQVDKLFHNDLKLFVDAANSAITAPISQSEFDAIVSVLFNIGKAWGDGVGNEASFIKFINDTGSITGRAAKSKDEIADAIMRFKYPTEIIGRRAKEARLFVEGNYTWKDGNNTASVAKYINMA